jgi:hypothetical protein
VVAGAREKAADAVDGVADAVDENRASGDDANRASEGDATRASDGGAHDADGADVVVTVDGGTVTVEVDSDSDAHVVVDGDDASTTEK